MSVGTYVICITVSHQGLVQPAAMVTDVTHGNEQLMDLFDSLDISFNINRYCAILNNHKLRSNNCLIL